MAIGTIDIGIPAHVDARKTTPSQRGIFATGSNRSAARTHDDTNRAGSGDHADFDDEVEGERSLHPRAHAGAARPSVGRVR